MNDSDKKFVGRVLILLVLFSIMAALTEIRVNPKKYGPDSAIQIESSR